MSKINLYCAGGAGLNIGAHFTKYVGKNHVGFADLDVFFIDTSKSNMNAGIPKDKVYILDDLDGSGKLRSSNYSALSECSKEILHQFRPQDLNVVIHSASGGTGSVMGPILVSELLSRSIPTIVIQIGNTSSRIETENTLKTLKSYEVISRKREVPVISIYRENTASTPRGRVDAEIQTMIVILTAIFSGSNKELDMADLANFLNYHKVTNYTPKLSMLDFFSKEIIVARGQAVVSLVTLIDEKTDSHVSVPVEYQAVGYLPDSTRENMTVELPIHGAVIANYFNTVVDTLEQKIATYDEARKIVVEKPIASRDQSSTDDGIVL